VRICGKRPTTNVTVTSLLTVVFHRVLMPAILALFLATVLSAAEPSAKVAFDLPAGDAARRLKEFAQLTKREILYPSEGLDRVQTNAVRGELTVREGLDRLIAGTGLKVFEDPKTGAWMIRSTEAPNGLRAAPSASDRPTANLDGKVVKLDTFEVFGSKSINLDLPRTRDDAQPYVVFGREQITQAQATNLQDFFRSRLPMATNIGLSTFTGGNPYGQTVNLRGLGTNQTLILVDGRRLPNYTTPGTLGGAITPEINGIPLGMIERIEVLPSTASGIYGGGATGGVINIITRKDYSGGDFTLSYVNTFDTDTARRRAELNFSTSLRGGATLLTLTASVQEANDLLTQDRSFAVRARQQGFANNPAAFTGPSSPPRGYTTNIRSRNGANLTLKPQYGGTTLGSFFTSVPVGYAGITSDNAAALVANAGRYNLALPDDVGGGRSRLATTASPLDSVGLGLRQKITTWLESYVDYQRNTNRMISSQLFGFDVGSNFTLAASAPNNPFTTAVNVAYPFTGLWTGLKTSNTVTRVAGGLVAKLPGEWQAGLDYVWGRNAFRFQDDNPLLRPTYGSALSTGVLDVMRDLNLRPLNYQPYLVSGQATDDHGKSLSNSLTLRTSGPTFRLPNGPVVVSASVEWRDDRNTENVSAGRDGSEETLSYFYYTPEVSGEGKSGYMEARVPLLAAEDGPSKQARLELQVAGRYDSSRATTVARPDFPLIPSPQGPFPATPMITRDFSSSSYTAGLRYAPVTDLVFRASFGTGFLAPDTSQLMGPELDSIPIDVSDPKRGGILETVGPVDYIIGGNPDLEPERSKSYAAGIVYTPRFWPGLRVSVDYTKIEKSDEIAFLTEQQLLDFEDSLPSGTILREPLTPADRAAGYTGGAITQIRNVYYNFSRREVEAVDFQVDYTRQATFGEFRGYAVATWNRLFAGQVVPSDELNNQVGYLGSPLKWKGNAGLDWTRGRWSAGWNAQYYDAQFIYAFTSRDFSAGTVRTQGTDRWNAQVYHDLVISYDLGHQAEGWLRPFSGMKFTLGLQNVFNREPPLRAGTSERTGFQNIEDPRLRRYSLTIKKHF